MAQGHRQPVGQPWTRPKFTTSEETRMFSTGDTVARGQVCFCSSSHSWPIPIDFWELDDHCPWRGAEQTRLLQERGHRGALRDEEWELITEQQCPLLLSCLLFFLWAVAISELPLGVTTEEQTNQDILREEKYFFPCLPWLALNE